MTFFSFLPRWIRIKDRWIVGKEFEHGVVVFFELQNELRLTIWHLKQAENAGAFHSKTGSEYFGGWLGWHTKETDKHLWEVVWGLS